MKKSFLALPLLLNLSLSIHAGTESSGGGGAFVCRDSKNQIINSELLDLWEAKYLDQREIDYSEEAVEIQIKRAVAKIALVDRAFSELVLKSSLDFMKNYYKIPQGLVIRTPQDTGHEYEKENCPLEGMMYYDGKKNLLNVNTSIFSKLISTTDVAASFVHEGVYQVLRNFQNDANSIVARKLVGMLFDKNFSFATMDPMSELPLNGDLYKCNVNNSEYYYFPNGKLDHPGPPVTQVYWSVVITKLHGQKLNDIIKGEFMTGYCQQENENTEHWLAINNRVNFSSKFWTMMKNSPRDIFKTWGEEALEQKFDDHYMFKKSNFNFKIVSKMFSEKSEDFNCKKIR